MSVRPQSTNTGTRSLAWTANACMFVFGIVLFFMGSLLPHLPVSTAQAGTLGSLPLLGILIATVVIGPLLDLMGVKPLLAIALLMISASLFAITQLRGFDVLAICAFIYGLGGGVLNTATNALVSQLSTSGRGAALNLLGAFFSLGAVAAPLMMAALGQASTALVVDALGAVTALVLLPVLLQRFPPGARAGTRLPELVRVLRHPLVWGFGALLFFESGNENCMFNWTGEIFTDALHTTAAQAEVALLSLSIALGVGRLAAIPVLRRIGSRRALLVSCALLAIGGGVSHLDGIVAAFCAVVIIGLGMSTVFPTALGIAGDHFPGETGTVFGAVISVALVGGVLGPKIGAEVARVDARLIFLIPVAAAVGIAVMTLIVSPEHASPAA